MSENTFTRASLGNKERTWFDYMQEHARKASAHLAKEVQYRDMLIISLHGRLAYATQKIASLIGQSQRFVKSEISRLRADGRIK